MRGEHEKACFEYVQRVMFCKDGSPITNPFNRKTYLTATDEEFSSEMLFYVNTDVNACFFGLTEQDSAEFYELMRKAIPNPSPSLFPDFIFDAGFIEHFAITSSRENRKGFKQRIADIAFEVKVKEETERFQEECNLEPSFDKIRSKEWTTTNPKHRYDNLLSSFRTHWEDHMESYKKYPGRKAIGVFMIENMEFALAMYENVYSNWVEGMSHGDYRTPENYKFHRLSRDKKLLEFCYQYHEQIKYVIYRNHQGFEVINTMNIPYLLKIIPWDYHISPMYVQRVARIENISIPCERGESNDQT